MAHLALLLQTLLLAWLVMVLPVRGLQRLRALAANPSPEAQIAVYRRGITRWWRIAAVAAVLLAMQGQSLRFALPKSNEGVLYVLVAGAGIAASVATAALLPPFRRFIAWQLSGLGRTHLLLPGSRSAALWFIPLAITAGICEEFIFRGLLPSVARRLLDLAGGGPAWVPMVASSVAFGAVHLYQGWRGVLLTGLVGATLYMVTVRTGSLLPGMAIHALIDLRIFALFFVMPRPRYGIEGAKGG